MLRSHTQPLQRTPNARRRPRTLQSTTCAPCGRRVTRQKRLGPPTLTGNRPSARPATSPSTTSPSPPPRSPQQITQQISPSPPLLTAPPSLAPHQTSPLPISHLLPVPASGSIPRPQRPRHLDPSLWELLGWMTRCAQAATLRSQAPRRPSTPRLFRVKCLG